jgi:hypothetical protein
MLTLVLLAAAGLPCAGEERDAAKADPKAAGSPPATTALRVQVQAGAPPKPVAGASVRVVAKGAAPAFEREVPSGTKGLAQFDKVPLGKVVIQVTATGFPTHGKEYTLEESQSRITITLEPETAKP